MNGTNRLLGWNEGPEPRRLGSCAECGCLVMPILFTDGRTGALDPGFVDRRWFRARLTRTFCEGQGFAWLGDEVRGHECPPESRCGLPRPRDWARAARLFRELRARKENGKGGRN